MSNLLASRTIAGLKYKALFISAEASQCASGPHAGPADLLPTLKSEFGLGWLPGRPVLHPGERITLFPFCSLLFIEAVTMKSGVTWFKSLKSLPIPRLLFCLLTLSCFPWLPWDIKLFFFFVPVRGNISICKAVYLYVCVSFPAATFYSQGTLADMSFVSQENKCKYIQHLN